MSQVTEVLNHHLRYLGYGQEEKRAILKRAHDIVQTAETTIDWMKDRIVLDAQKPGLIGFPKSSRTPEQIRFGKPKTFIKFCAQHANIEVQPEELDKIAYTVGDVGLLSPIIHEIVSGMALWENYGVVGSCFTNPAYQVGGTGKEFVKFYSDNPEKIEMIIVKKDGEGVARALLWTLDSGNKLVCRIYQRFHGATDYIKKLAKDNGWYCQGVKEGRGKVTGLKIRDDMPPYLDHTNGGGYCSADDTLWVNKTSGYSTQYMNRLLVDRKAKPRMEY